MEADWILYILKWIWIFRISCFLPVFILGMEADQIRMETDSNILDIHLSMFLPISIPSDHMHARPAFLFWHPVSYPLPIVQ